MLENNAFDFDSISIPDKCKMITVLVRIDRFREGTLVSAFREGLIFKMIQSINKQVLIVS